MFKIGKNIKDVFTRLLCDRFKNGAVYDGQWVNGMKNGLGVFVYPDGSKYHGNDNPCFFVMERAGNYNFRLKYTHDIR